MNQFIPRCDPQLCLWLENYSRRLAAYGPRFGLTAEEISQQQQLCAQLGEAIRTDDQKHKEWRAAVKKTREVKKSALGAMRSMIDRIKHLPGWSPEIGQAMGIVKPTLAATAVAPTEPEK